MIGNRNPKGAGRKPAAYGPTTTIRVPIGVLPMVKHIVNNYKTHMLNKKTN